MSKQFLVLVSFCLVFTTFVFAQQKISGVIYYTQVIDTRAMRAGEGAPQQAPRTNGFNMPDKITNKMEIIYNATGAKLQKSVEEDISQSGNGEGMRVMRFGGNADREVLFSLADKKVTESFEMDGEQLLMEKTLGSNSSGAVSFEETRKIAGFDCNKVSVKEKNGSETTIWYTKELAFSASPVPALWTEGVVLGIENQRMKFYATEIEYIKIKDSELALPKKARLISEEEYTIRQTEFRKKMQEQFRNRGGSNQTIIRESGN